MHLWTFSQTRAFTIQYLVSYSLILTHQTLTLQPERACKAIFGQACSLDARWQKIGVVQHQLSLYFLMACVSKVGVVMTRIKGRTMLRENVRIGAGLGRKELWAEEEAAESRNARAVNLRPDRLPSPNLCPDGSAKRKSFAPQKSRIKDMPINVLFPLSPANPTSTPPSGCLLMLSSLSFPTQLVWRAPP